MAWPLVPTILQMIEQSPLQNVPTFVSHILENEMEYRASVAPINSCQGTHVILDSLLRVCQSTVLEWAINTSKDILRQELIQASNVRSGLHFNASHAHSADLVGFDLEDIAGKLKTAAPLTWDLVQTLLDANLILWHRKCKPLKKTADCTQLEDDMSIGRESDDGSASDEGIGEVEVDLLDCYTL